MNIKRGLAVCTTAVIVGLAGIVGIAGPTSAHTPEVVDSCADLSVKLTQYEESRSNPTPNNVKVYVDDKLVGDHDFGNSFSKVYGFENKYVAHSWKVVIDAAGNNYDKTIKGTSKPCDRPVPPKPPVKEVPGSSETIVCESEKAVQKNWKDVTTYTFDEKAWEWVGTTNRVELADTHRALTADELRNCAGDQPDPKVDYSHWRDEALDCNSKSVKQTRTVVTTTYSLVGTKWVANEPVTTTEVQYRPKTEEEKYECLPETNANAGASIVAICGAADVTLTNEKVGEKQKTASFVVYVDGAFYSAHAVAVGESESVNLTFPEDSGDHVVTVRSGPAFGDVLLATATVHSDCILPADDRETRWFDTLDCETALVTSQEQERTRSYSYVEGVPVAGEWSEWTNTDTEPVVREASIEELDEAECPVEEKPEDKVTTTTQETITKLCGVDHADVVTTKTSVPFILVDRVWVEDTENAVTTTVNSERPLTDAEKKELAAELNCDKSLAITGLDEDGMIAAIWLAIILTLGGTGMLVRSRMSA